MIVNGSTKILVNGKQTRVLGSTFNMALKKSERRGEELIVFCMTEDEPEAKLVPSKGLSWQNVAANVRAGKATQAKVEKPKKTSK